MSITTATTLRELGISISVYAANSDRLNEAAEYVASSGDQAEPSIINAAIETAQEAAEAEPDAAAVDVSIYYAGEWHSVWFTERIAGRWPWTI